MLSARSRLVPHFSSDIDHPIEEFLQEYEELADIHGLTEAQKVTTVTLLSPIFLSFGLPPLLRHPHYLTIALTTLCLLPFLTIYKA